MESILDILFFVERALRRNDRLRKLLINLQKPFPDKYSSVMDP